jgi:hypothetical protein
VRLRAVIDAGLKANQTDAGGSFYRVLPRLQWIEDVLAPATDVDEASPAASPPR